ncbi:MAG: hypothetical protein RLZZ156_2888 [Deinococcota bacterium]|jgi:endonuclease/exonuclease/phosphatase family metal-dependent hydrolase
MLKAVRQGWFMSWLELGRLNLECAKLFCMNVHLTKTSVEQIAKLQRIHALSETEIIEQALLLMGQDNADWDAILADDPINHDLSEEEAVVLAVSEVRAYRNSKK